jgi:hypothetical protein
LIRDLIFYIADNYGKFVERLFKRTVNREIIGFNKVLSSFKILGIELKILYVGLVAVVLAYDGYDEVLDT